MKKCIQLFAIMFPLISISQTLGLIGHKEVPILFFGDLWGFERDGKQYITVGITDSTRSGVAIYDVSQPDSIIEEGFIEGMKYFDIKVYKNFIYSVDYLGYGSYYDISDLTDPIYKGPVESQHNIWIDPRGYLISREFEVYKIDETDGSLTIVASGNANAHDILIKNDRLYTFGDNGAQIYDFSNPENPIKIGEITDSKIVYGHSGDVSDNGNYLYICDEGAEDSIADITVWDISDVSNPEKMNQFIDTSAVAHNFYIKGDWAFCSYYTAGFRVFHVGDYGDLSLVCEYDTSPDTTGEVFNGNFGVYIYGKDFPIIYSNDNTTGLFAFHFDEYGVGVKESGSASDKPLTLYPNPASHQIQLSDNDDYWVRNIKGEVIEQFSGQDFGVDHLKNGAYYIENDGGLGSWFVVKR